MKKYDPCEEFYKYARLEGRPRQTEIDDALAARIHDPLWMLARQYQFGEFQGEDAGSAIYAKVALNSKKISGFRHIGSAHKPFDGSQPLETKVERTMPAFDNKMGYRMGKRFLELFDLAGKETEGWPGDAYSNDFINAFPYVLPEMDIGQSAGQLAAAARAKASTGAHWFLKAMAGKAMNGAALWSFLKEDPERIKQLVISATTTNVVTEIAGQTYIINRFIAHEHQEAARNAATEWINWVRERWNLPESPARSAWVDEKLEYSFDIAVAEGQNRVTDLHAEAYHHGHLDWFAMDAGRNRPVRAGEKFAAGDVVREVKTMIPTQAEFMGMPNARWWELEDGRVDPGNLKASDTDVVAVLLSQFALYYSNDWLMIPLDIECGSLTEIEGIVITDTFGQKTMVEAAHKAEQHNWKSWTIYSLARFNGGSEPVGLDNRLLLLPSAAKVIEGAPLEEIRFIRDEMANMVWGIERIVPDGMGSGIDGYEIAANITGLYRKLDDDSKGDGQETMDQPIADALPGHQTGQTKPPLKYNFGNTITENWIPFIPVHLPGSYREIHLQRASMPRITSFMQPHQVRPVTPLLRSGIDDSDSQSKPMYIFEEEVPRAGAVVKGAYQRTRWFNGRVVTWYGRQKTTGRGEGSSGLMFDYVSDNK